MGGIYWLASYPKSGNTWFRTFLCNLQEDGSVPVDINALRTSPIATFRGWLDEVLGFDTADLTHDEIERLRPDVYGWSKHDKEIGYHKIHDAYSLTQDGEPLVGREATLGALYIIRNPLDVAVSTANFWNCSLDEAVDRLCYSEAALCTTRRALRDHVRSHLGNWSQHVLSWVDAPGLNVEVLRFEDMLAKPMEAFSRATRFLGLPDDPIRVAKAIRFSEFRELARQEAASGFRERPRISGRFFRNGQIGDGQKHLSSGQIERIIAAHGSVMSRFGYV